MGDRVGVGGREQGAGSSSDNTPIVADTLRGGDKSQGPGAAGRNEQVVAQSLAIRGRDGTPQAELGDDGKANALLTPNGGRGGVGAGAIFATVPRRLTPTECSRLQGFPDTWTLIPGAKDSPRYRALGNAVAVPCVQWIMHRIARHYGTGPVISLFAGIGGFDLAGQRAGFTTAWFAEIEPFACRVLTERFPDVPNRGNVMEAGA